MRPPRLLALALLALLTSACTTKDDAAAGQSADSAAAGAGAPTDARPVDLAADEQAIRKGSQDWLAAYRRRDVDGVIANYADDAVAVYGGKVLTGRAAIRKNLEDELARVDKERPGFTPSWETTAVHVAQSGDLAYETGTYEDVWNEGKSRERGQFLTVFRKVDGQWKVAQDMTAAEPTSSPARQPAP